MKWLVALQLHIENGIPESTKRSSDIMELVQKIAVHTTKKN